MSHRAAGEHDLGARGRALAGWARLVRDFLAGLTPGGEIAAEGLARLLERRAPLLPDLAGQEPFQPEEAELALRLQVLEEELQRRVEQDLARRRKSLDELNLTRQLLRGYAEDRESLAQRPSRFIDTRS